MNYRDQYRPIIAKVLAEHDGEPIAKVRAALRQAFPMGPREYWPYKVWLDEVREQLGLKEPKPVSVPLPGQREMF